MLVPGYMGEAGYLNSTVGFVIGMLGWAFILTKSMLAKRQGQRRISFRGHTKLVHYDEVGCYGRLAIYQWILSAIWK